MYAEAIEKNLALRLAFEKACVDLGMSAADTNRRENLALMMLKIAKDGEQDAFAVKRRAVDIMRQSRL
jgi:hypothetical protein